MLPGPLIQMSCPHCSARFLLRTLRSGNTFGSTLYSDGWLRAPMLPETPGFHLCRACGRAFWIRAAGREGEFDPYHDEVPSEIPIAEVPGADEHRQALAQGLARTPEEERELRLGWWWAVNHAERDGSPAEPPPGRPEAWEANLARLAGLMDRTDPMDRLFLAEMARERGRFAEAAALLKLEFPENLQGVARSLAALVEGSTSRVQALPEEA